MRFDDANSLDPDSASMPPSDWEAPHGTAPHGTAPHGTAPRGAGTKQSAGAEIHSTYQLSGIVLRVRDDIDILVREYGGQPIYVIEDGLSSRYYRIGAAEYSFLQMLDGKTNFATALGRTAAVMRRDALTEDRAAVFCKWLVDSGLASTEQSRSVERLVEHQRDGQRRRVKGRLGAISQRIPLLSPRRSVEWLHHAFGWMFSVPIALVWLGLVGTGVAAVALHWERFTASTHAIISSSNWLYLILTWLVLKLVHEAAHATACRRFGGWVREAGVLLIVLIPMPYVDVTSSWRLASRWQRIVVSSAGMMAELAIAAIAAIVWSQAPPGLVSQQAMNVIASAGLMTLVFNANPLMRFDGYFILTDLIEMPNLYAHGQQAVTQLGRRWLLGLPAQPKHYPEGRHGLVLAYGWAALVWRVMVCVGLVLAADAMLYGLGTLLAIAAVLGWAIVPAFKLVRFVALGSKTEHPSRIRFATIMFSASFAALLALSWMPWYGSETAPLVVDYYPQVELRAPAAGFIEQSFARSAQQVSKGQTLLVLRNDDLATRIGELEIELQISERRADGYLNRKEVAAFQVEQEAAVALRKRLRELQEQQSQLVVKSPVDGIVLSGDLDDQLGTYVVTGSLLIRLGCDGQKKLLALVDQTQQEQFRRRVGQSVSVHLDGTGTGWSGSQLVELSPRADRKFPHPAVAAHAGGPLDVRLCSESDSDGSEHSHSSDQFELWEPHFLAVAQLPRDGDHLLGLQPGQTGRLSFLGSDASLGHHLRDLLAHWWNRRRQAVEQQLYVR